MSDIVERLRGGVTKWGGVDCAPDAILAAADEIERLREVLALGIHMREAQTTYFKTRSKDALVAAKALEAEFLHRARALLEEKQ